MAVLRKENWYGSILVCYIDDSSPSEGRMASLTACYQFDAVILWFSLLLFSAGSTSLVDGDLKGDKCSL